jgi:hypothetical protein
MGEMGVRKCAAHGANRSRHLLALRAQMAARLAEILEPAYHIALGA